jgi:hypothetical protein
MVITGGDVSRADDDPCTAYEERAAIMEHEAGLPRLEAERKARQDVATYAQRLAKAMERQRGLFDG